MGYLHSEIGHHVNAANDTLTPIKTFTSFMFVLMSVPTLHARKVEFSQTPVNEYACACDAGYERDNCEITFDCAKMHSFES